MSHEAKRKAALELLLRIHRENPALPLGHEHNGNILYLFTGWAGVFDMNAARKAIGTWWVSDWNGIRTRSRLVLDSGIVVTLIARAR